MISLQEKKKIKTTKLLEVSVCVPTFRRPESLRRLLKSFLELLDIDFLKMEFVIVDNDSSQSAKPVFEEFKHQFPNFNYFTQSEQNIALTRNMLVEESCGEWIAFIDDDEVADKQWLASYLELKNRLDGDGFFGPVYSVFESEPPAWLERDFFFKRKSFLTGAQIPEQDARTGNAFLKRKLFLKNKFDPDFGLTGGEDSDLFARMIEKEKANFFWCNEAIVREYVPKERLDWRWLIKRSFRTGITFTIVSNRKTDNSVSAVLGLIKSTAGTIFFLLHAIVSIFRQRKYLVKSAMRLSLQIGHILGFFNYSYNEYKVKPANHSFSK